MIHVLIVFVLIGQARNIAGGGFPGCASPRRSKLHVGEIDNKNGLARVGAQPVFHPRRAPPGVHPYPAPSSDFAVVSTSILARMKSYAGAASLIGALLSAPIASAAPAVTERDVDTRYPYTGPAVPIGDWVDNTINGNGKGFPRLVEPPAVKPLSSKPKNNINVISTSYVVSGSLSRGMTSSRSIDQVGKQPEGINIHFQTPFGLGKAPTVHWGLSPENLCYTARGQTKT